MLELERAVPLRLPAFEVAVPELQAAEARTLVRVLGDLAVRERRVRGHELEDRTGRILRPARSG